MLLGTKGSAQSNLTSSRRARRYPSCLVGRRIIFSLSGSEMDTRTVSAFGHARSCNVGTSCGLRCELLSTDSAVGYQVVVQGSTAAPSKRTNPPLCKDATCVAWETYSVDKTSIDYADIHPYTIPNLLSSRYYRPNAVIYCMCRGSHCRCSLSSSPLPRDIHTQPYWNLDYQILDFGLGGCSTK